MRATYYTRARADPSRVPIAPVGPRRLWEALDAAAPISSLAARRDALCRVLELAVESLARHHDFIGRPTSGYRTARCGGDGRGPSPSPIFAILLPREGRDALCFLARSHALSFPLAHSIGSRLLRGESALRGESGGYVDCPIYDRYTLLAGALLEGPAIIEEMDSTTVVHPAHRVEVDEFGNLIICKHHEG